ncbi:DUF3265 domain-containing protein [Vibrio parahaemolyticus]|nr:DUF3265 domain-containing protein [Vibrio parahaemolyticus]EIV8646796.1 DUF3265 domain-containing protein [Vibrio parahaemolyticus]EIV8675785.1 DUF3265 domain-containing protein [Vibrio parahaemolyticus]EJR0962461.1 DUF3265 domain-containing protein [Vibrio parahaemolyticus]EKB1965736.1 DUF3265 domain-containing protein [Vibrio parahaemolyticus]
MKALGLATNKLLKRDLQRVAFYYALTLVIKVVCGGFTIALFTP